MKKISILGSTGSIGVNALEVIDSLNGKFKVSALSAKTNSKLLVQQAIKYRPNKVSIIDENTAKYVKSELKKYQIKVLIGREGLLELASLNNIDIMLNGLVGSAGMAPTLNAIQAGVDVALSNKESLVMAGDIIEQEKEKSGAQILPVDSEHSAIWQCLRGERMEDVERIFLTGSGGPFRTRPLNTFKDIKPVDALKHPNWSMGRKITVDSATMMNKGLELIEMYWLFGVDVDKIDIIIHPQSIIHSMVEFKDRSVKAQLGVPDMRVPIQYALTYPQHVQANWDAINLIDIGTLTFESLDRNRFPCVDIAYNALAKKGSATAVINVANEQAVYRFLKEEIRFIDIPLIIEKAYEKHNWVESPNLIDLFEIEKWATRFTKEFPINKKIMI